MLIKGILYTYCPGLNRYESILQGKEEKIQSPELKIHFLCGYRALYACSCPDVNAYSYNALEKTP